jgi:hypothetical protein
MTSRNTLIENEYANLWYYPEEGIIHHQFLQPIADEEFYKVLKTGLGLMQEYGAQKWLSDDRNNSILSAEDSAWSQNYWLPRAYEAGWKQWAVLPPLKARGQINMKRLMDYVGEKYGVNIKIFSDPDKAWQWLAQQGSS